MPFFSVFAQKQTTVSGLVLDSRSKEVIPFANIQFNNGSAGTSTDHYGRFLIESVDAQKEIKVSCLGYETKFIKVKANQHNEISVELRAMEAILKEITVHPDKYKRKNPAVDLIHQVFLHKDENRKDALPFYQFDTHERLRMDLNGVTEKFKNRWYFNPFEFAFDFCDTNQINQKVALPFYLRERLLTTYYRKNPGSKKELLLGERQTAIEDDYDIDKDGVSTYITNLYTDIDIYEPIITLLNKQFVGPLSSNATTFYRFYITDTVKTAEKNYARVFFSPINKNDLAFIGNLMVVLDSTYAVQSVDMGISKDINLNWVSEIRIKQDFAFQGEGKERRLLLNSDLVLLDMKIWKNREGRSLLAMKSNSYRNYKINFPQPDSLYTGSMNLLRDTGAMERTPEFWLEKRHEQLNHAESEIKTMVDSVKGTTLFRAMKSLSMLMSRGYQRVGILEVGEIGNLLRYNDLEGARVQLSLRTADRHFKHMRFKAYGAYGLLDKEFKYGISTTIAFKGARPSRFPSNQIRFSYDHDLYFPGFASNAGQGLVNSLQRTGTNRLLWNDVYNIDYVKEYKNRFSYSVFARHRTVKEAADFFSEPQNNRNDNNAVTSELGIWIRYAPNERIFQGVQSRSNITSKFPVFLFQYKVAVKGLLGSDYAFQRASLRMDKTLFLGIMGRTKFAVEAGRVFGQVSYPLLEIHRTNQGYFFDNNGFNLMNYLEFVSDKYVMMHVNHNFGGIVLNRIPAVKKLRLREGVSFKAVYGGLDSQNIPSSTNQLLKFPVNDKMLPITRALGNVPYMEASAGISNIFGFLRIDYIWRLNYLSQPDIQKWGIKALFDFDF
ncbi:MAG: DUF5686 family protein [Saprospiraceae bacterium]